EDHRFVDSTGAAHVGRERMREAWLQYFAMFPDYRIAISTTFSSGERAALFGTTCATSRQTACGSRCMRRGWPFGAGSGLLIGECTRTMSRPALPCGTDFASCGNNHLI